MSLIDVAKKMRDDIVISMSKVSQKHDEEKEKLIREEFDAKLNYDKPDPFTQKNNKKTGQIDDIKIREISNGDDKYSVQDLLYSYRYDGRTSVWQYGFRIEDKDVNVREISVTKDGKTSSLILKKENGKYHEHGDSRDSGDFYDSTAKFSEYARESFSIPSDLDLSDTNAIRYHFRNDKKIAQFLDKYVIVTPDERKSYKEYAKEQDKAFAIQKSQRDKLKNIIR